ncbi:LysR family transcriptional regulator [Pokkaliibacter plantistimulans]|uniref:LysR family transcriptional regulator n=1 Tax=Proteobacteria bacterium 228 TaxID=2083153 RepID=A0A2S5KGU9_9PROT|nr:LysR substrate-binding domain-containing protein [Pokkaliibacter plantistimulans]PPC73990.1 LysR family transcriptional regulator [Pokkaliibacter plantistimulans]
MENLESDLLRVFVAVIECRGFSAAAERLHKTQSTVSQRLQKLEEMVGTPLMVRNSRSVALTAAGETFLIYAKQILKLHREAIDAATSKSRADVLRIGLPEDYAQHFLSPALTYLRQHYPEIRPDIVCETSTQLVARVHRGELDLALAVRHANTVQGEYLCDEPLVWVASPLLQLQADKPIPLAVYPEGCIFRAHGIAALTAAGRGWQVVYTSQSPGGIGIAIDAGEAVGITSLRLLPRHWRVLTEADGFPPLQAAELMFYYSPGVASPYVQPFASQLADALVMKQAPLCA